MASYTLNEAAVAHARKLIDARQDVLDSDWGEVGPGADEENAFLRLSSLVPRENACESWPLQVVPAKRNDPSRERRPLRASQTRDRAGTPAPGSDLEFLAIFRSFQPSGTIRLGRETDWLRMVRTT